MRLMVIPLPSIPEQQVIAKKVDQLLTKVDSLEAQVKTRQEQADQLMQAVLREAFDVENDR